MSIEFTDTERSVLLEFHENVLLVNTLRQYCDAKSQDFAQACVGDMTQVPPSLDRARNHAGKADFYKDFMADLMRTIEQV